MSGWEAMMCRRPVLASVILAVIAAAGSSPASAKSATIGWRPGGDVYTHIAEALDMIRSGKTYRVTGDQYSAAAMQVVYLESQMPERICASPKAKLHFHLGFDRQTRRPIKALDPVWVAFIRPENLKRLGRLPEYGKGFKTVRASAYLGLCR
ncbi:MAG: hypothetical protein AB7P20_21905 [Rhizobiaceae bacterium]